MRDRGCDVLIVGAGILGLTIARELVRSGARDILILDKEAEPGIHASGRNSGVLHAGIYYTADSHKARFCAAGNRRMREFCRERGLTLRETGKVIVTKAPAELDRLDELKRRADACGARASFVDRIELKDIEPHASTCERALYSPDTAVIRPREILDALVDELTRGPARVVIAWGTSFDKLSGSTTAVTSLGTIRFGRFVNAGGAFADRVARRFGLASDYRVLPFKGTYRRVRQERASLVRGNIYPVPDLRNPFLGVHFTRTAEEEVHVGPTAIPALGREHYRGLRGVSLESLAIVARDAVLLLRNPAFRTVAVTETRKYLRHVVAREAQKLVPDIVADDLLPATKVGIRPQLVHWPTKRLVMDFVVLKDGHSLHVLNAISPAFTSAMPFAEYAVDTLLGRKGEAGVVSVSQA